MFDLGSGIFCRLMVDSCTAADGVADSLAGIGGSGSGGGGRETASLAVVVVGWRNDFTRLEAGRLRNSTGACPLPFNVVGRLVGAKGVGYRFCVDTNMGNCCCPRFCI